MSHALFAMAKMEEDYIDEWVKYHLGIGFDKIYLYDNEDKPTYFKILQKYGNKVFVKHFPGMAKKGGMQNIVIFHFCINFARFHNYIMHIDVDEFFCLKKHKSVKELTNEYIKPDTAALAFNWVFFGSNNLKEKENKPVTERFTKCQEGVNKHIKLLVDTKKIVKYVGCHFIHSIPGTFTKDTKGKIITTLFNENGDNSVGQINHYKVKSEEEFRRIVKRPRPDAEINNPNKMWRNNFDEEFPKYNFNDIEDLTAKNLYQDINN